MDDDNVSISSQINSSHSDCDSETLEQPINFRSSTSSGQFRRQRWGPQKRRRPRPKKFFGRTRREWCRFLTEWIVFYTTLFFVLLAIASFFSLVFLVPFFIDPAWSTLQADFDLEGRECRTVSGKYLEGRSNCEWSSCEEGCTKTIFTCWQIEVKYDSKLTDPESIPRNTTSIGKLFPNIKGCGYPPQVNCTRFISMFSQPDSSFTCFVSRTDPSLAIVDLDLKNVQRDLMFSLAVPIPLLIFSLGCLCFIYTCFYKEKVKKPYRPVASTAAGAALAALLELNVMDDSKDASRKDDKCHLNRLTPTDLRLSAVANALEKDKQRKLLLKVTKTKLMAAKEKLPPETAAKASLLAAAMIANAAPKSKSNWPLVIAGMPGGQPPMLDLSKLGSVRLRELQEAHLRKYGVASDDMDEHKPDPVQIYRQQYNAEKYKVMQYYQYYPT